MDQLLRIVLAFLVVVGAIGAEVQPPMARDMECPVAADGPCPCGMPMAPLPEPEPCCSTLPVSMVAPSRTSATVVRAVAADLALPEPAPWPASWDARPRPQDQRRGTSASFPVDTGPPLHASERAARLGVFRI